MIHELLVRYCQVVEIYPYVRMFSPAVAEEKINCNVKSTLPLCNIFKARPSDKVGSAFQVRAPFIQTGSRPVREVCNPLKEQVPFIYVLDYKRPHWRNKAEMIHSIFFLYIYYNINFIKATLWWPPKAESLLCTVIYCCNRKASVLCAVLAAFYAARRGNCLCFAFYYNVFSQE